MVSPIFIELITVTSFFLRSGVNKNKGIMKTAYHIAHSGPTILMCSYSLVFKPYKFSVSPPGQTNIIKNKIDLGLSIDSSVNYEFEKNLKHKNYIFSNSIDFVQEFFNFERKLNNNLLSKSLKILGKNSYINKLFTKVADKGINF